MYRNDNQIVFAADLLKPRFSVKFAEKTNKPTAQRDPDGDHVAINALIIAQNTEMEASANGPEHGRKPQKREVTILVNPDTGEIVPTTFKESVRVTKDDEVIRSLTPYSGGGQLARIDLGKVTNLEEAVQECLAELAD